MFREKYTKELAKHGDISLVMYVSEDDNGEHTQYVVCRWYDATEPVGQQWYSGDYYGSDKLVEATEAFKARSGYRTESDKAGIPKARLEEIATRFKDVLVDEFAFTRNDFAEDGDGSYRDLDLTEKELNFFEIPEDEDGEDEDEDLDLEEDDENSDLAEYCYAQFIKDVRDTKINLREH